MSHDPNDPLTARARALFDRAAVDVEPATAARLRAMRREALRHGGMRRERARWPTLVPLAAALVVALGAAWWIAWPVGDRDDAPVLATDATPPDAMPSPVDATPATTAIDPDPASPAAAGSDEIARLLDSEDPDLYAWLADAPVAAGSPP